MSRSLFLLKCLEQEDEALPHAAIDGLAMFGPSLRNAVGELSVYESMQVAFEPAERILDLLQRHPDTGVRYQEAGIRILAQREDAAGWAFIEQIAGDHPHECNELANLFLKRYKEGRTQPAWSG